MSRRQNKTPGAEEAVLQIVGAASPELRATVAESLSRQEQHRRRVMAERRRRFLERIDSGEIQD